MYFTIYLKEGLNPFKLLSLNFKFIFDFYSFKSFAINTCSRVAFLKLQMWSLSLD